MELGNVECRSDAMPAVEKKVSLKKIGMFMLKQVQEPVYVYM